MCWQCQVPGAVRPDDGKHEPPITISVQVRLNGVEASAPVSATVRDGDRLVIEQPVVLSVDPGVGMTVTKVGD